MSKDTGLILDYDDDGNLSILFTTKITIHPGDRILLPQPAQTLVPLYDQDTDPRSDPTTVPNHDDDRPAV